jgi:CPA1 family monovalent cation:H+ antiporter
MTGQFEVFLPLLVVLAAVALLARRLDTAPSILLVVVGAALTLVPGLPQIQLAPAAVLLVVLPPLIYIAGVSMSWREFRFNLRPIALLAVGCVVFSTCAVAVAVHYALGFPWAVGFVLGAIVAPPDVVAPLAIARRLGLPQRLLVVLEGEGLANDATALILYRFAVAAASTGAFSLPHAVGTFALIVIGEIAYGIAIGWLSLRLRRWSQDPRVELTLSVITPYVAYWLPEHLGGSGVLATVAAGLYVSWRGPLLISSATRLQGVFFWDLIIYLIEGFVFLLTGLQARSLMVRVSAWPVTELAGATLLVVAAIVAARFVWVFPATYLPRWLSPTLARRDPAPPWTFVFALGFTGIRGVVSLTAALAIPLTVSAGVAFPDRDLVLFLTFGVLVVTIIGMGLGLPPVVRWLGLDQAAAGERAQMLHAELNARHQIFEAVLGRLAAIGSERNLPPAVLRLLHDHFHVRRRQYPPKDGDYTEELALVSAVRLELIAFERQLLHTLLRDGAINDDSRRRFERELDLEEAGVYCKGEDSAELPL